MALPFINNLCSPVRGDVGGGLEGPAGGGLGVGDGHLAGRAGRLGCHGEGRTRVVHAVVAAL